VVATQGVCKRNPCWPGWRPAGGREHRVYACHRALESSMTQTDGQTLPIITIRYFKSMKLVNTAVFFIAARGTRTCLDKMPDVTRNSGISE